MAPSEEDAQSLVRDGAAALEAGRAGEARRLFERSTEAGAESEEAWLLLAAACGVEGDRAGEEDAANRLLELEPESVRGHVLKGDCRARAGDDLLAGRFYRTALALAEGRDLSSDAAVEVAHAKQKLADLLAEADAKRMARLTQRGFPPERWSPRLRKALDIAAGRSQIYFQQPTSFTYPELPQVQYYDPAQFAWAAAIEAATPAIRTELTGLLDSGLEQFRPYIQTFRSTAPIETNKVLVNSKDWSVVGLCENGWIAPELIARCPRTWETVLAAPMPRIAGWGPTVVFSMLRAGAHIAPHTGTYNCRLICHLPLIVPPGCRFRVGNEVREWEVGKLLIFDDTIEHEAWNDSDEDRVVLIFDVWRPELSEQEKQEATALFSD